MRKQALGLLEEQSRSGSIDLYYGDESQVSTEGYVPYGWQFKEEDVYIESARGKGINCFALISRDNRLHYATSEQNITADFIIAQLEGFSFKVKKPTVVVLDNATVHTAAKVKEALQRWQQRGLYLFYLPAYCPHLNLAERLWKELKARWLRPQDYLTAQDLFYAVSLALAAVGNEMKINFSDFSL